MLLRINKLGAIKEAEINLDKDLLIFCGPNNSGKTYLAYTVYGLYRHLSKARQPFLRLPVVKDNQIDIYDYLYASKASLEEYIGAFHSVLPDVFATDEAFFKSTRLSIEKIDWTLIKHRISEAVLESTINTHYGQIQVRKPIGTTLCTLAADEQDSLIPNKRILRDLSTSFFFQRWVLQYMFPNTFIAPTERTAVNIFSKELSIRRNEILDQLLELKDKKNRTEDPFLLLDRKAQRYTLPIRESLLIAEDLANLQKQESSYAYLADLLEQSLLKGRMEVSKDGEMLFRPNTAKSKKIGLNLTASVAKSLSSIVFYFRHLARKGDFIIIDEPELNLHPDNQRLIARFLARVVNAGFKVLLSTHSDYIIREFNNLIMLHQTGKEAGRLQKKYGYDKAELVDYKQIGVYLFSDAARKNVEEIDVTQSGFEVESIDRTIHELNESSQEIYLSLF